MLLKISLKSKILTLKDINKIEIVKDENGNWKLCVLSGDKNLGEFDKAAQAYIEFIESGNVYDILPLSKDKPKAIRVYFKYLPKDEKVINFLDNVSEILLKSNSMIRFECLPFES